MKIKKIYLNVDWAFLFFIFGVVNVKTYIKIISLIFYVSYLFYKKNIFSNKIAGPLKFYLLIPLAGIMSPLLNHSFHQVGYFMGFLFGLSEWMVCAASFYVMFCVVQKTDKIKLINTVTAFFIANIFIVIVQLIRVMVASHSVMPYWEDGASGDFGVSTGDYLYGIFGNSSIANACVCIMGGIYFLYIRKNILSISCFVLMLLCTSNLSLFISLFMLFIMFVFINSRKIKIKAISIMAILVFLYPVLSFSNLTYIKNIYVKYISHSVLINNTQKPTGQSKQIQMQPGFRENLGLRYKLDINASDSLGYISRLKELRYLSDIYGDPNSVVKIDQTQIKRSFPLIYCMPIGETPLNTYSKPGKIYSFHQTVDFLKSGYGNLFFGAGIGNFSSKLAIKMTGLGIQGKYPENWIYASPSFVSYHLYTLLYYFAQNVALHSVLNTPNSVFNQLAGEYGLVGMVLFVIFYLGYFWKNWDRLSYSKFLIIALLLLLNVEYWFEMASLTVIFELLLLMDIFVYTKKDADRPTPHNRVNAGI